MCKLGYFRYSIKKYNCTVYTAYCILYNIFDLIKYFYF